jgi:hypothetical protein
MSTVQEQTRRALAASGRAIADLFRTLPPDLARFKPALTAWSALEILNHLADEEAEDFRLRLSLTLETPESPWPPIDPEGWVTERDYLDRDPEETLQRFETQRSQSLEWLASLDAATPWQQKNQAADNLSLRAGDLAAAWIDHDLAHLIQLARVIAQAHHHHQAPFQSDYSGADWHRQKDSTPHSGIS